MVTHHVHTKGIRCIFVPAIETHQKPQTPTTMNTITLIDRQYADTARASGDTKSFPTAEATCEIRRIGAWEDYSTGERVPAETVLFVDAESVPQEWWDSLGDNDFSIIGDCPEHDRVEVVW